MTHHETLNSSPQKSPRTSTPGSRNAAELLVGISDSPSPSKKRQLPSWMNEDVKRNESPSKKKIQHLLSESPRKHKANDETVTQKSPKLPAIDSEKVNNSPKKKARVITPEEQQSDTKDSLRFPKNNNKLSGKMPKRNPEAASALLQLFLVDSQLDDELYHPSNTIYITNQDIILLKSQIALLQMISTVRISSSVLMMQQPPRNNLLWRSKLSQNKRKKNHFHFLSMPRQDGNSNLVSDCLVPMKHLHIQRKRAAQLILNV